MVLFPFLLYVWSAWYILRQVLRENAVDQLDERIYIGRRLLASEVPRTFDNVVDLTCEFTEPKSIRTVKNYVSFPILDAYAPPLKPLRELAVRIAAFEGTTFIHCAQGHGRTGMVAAAVVMQLHPELSPIEAIARLKAVRPALSCNTGQRKALAALVTAAPARAIDDGQDIVPAET